MDILIIIKRVNYWVCVIWRQIDRQPPPFFLF